MASIAKRPDGQWRARYRAPDGKEHSRHFARKVDAQQWLDRVTAAVVTGAYVDPKAGKVTFNSFYADWSKRQLWQRTTVLTMDLAARSVPFGDMPLNRVRKSHLEAWVKAMTSRPTQGLRPLAPMTIVTRFQHVRSVLRAAVDDRLIAVDPSAGVRLPAVRRTRSIPTPQQVGALLETADPDFGVLIALAAFAGLRLGEAAGVQVGDVEFLRRQLRVERQVQRAGGGEVEIRPPKYGSERTVYLADGLLAMISELVARRGIGDDPTAWLFVGQNGIDPPYHNTIDDRWRRACKRAGVSGITLHALRHFYASGLIAAGCDVVTVQRALGHHSATTTLRTYAHLWPTAEDRTRAAAADLMASSVNLADSVRTGEQAKRS
jgi:integrase